MASLQYRKTILILVCNITFSTLAYGHKTSRSSFQSLPNDVVKLIFNLGTVADHFQKRTVCTGWKNEVERAPNWKSIVEIKKIADYLSSIQSQSEFLEKKDSSSFEFYFEWFLHPVMDQLIRRLEGSSSLNEQRLGEAFRVLQHRIQDQCFKMNRQSHHPRAYYLFEQCEMRLRELPVNSYSPRLLNELSGKSLAGQLLEHDRQLFFKGLSSANLKGKTLQNLLKAGLHQAGYYYLMKNGLLENPNLSFQNQKKILNHTDEIARHKSWRKWETYELLSRNPNLKAPAVFQMVTDSLRTLRGISKNTNLDARLRDRRSKSPLQVLGNLACHAELGTRMNLREEAISYLIKGISLISPSILQNGGPGFNCLLGVDLDEMAAQFKKLGENHQLHGYAVLARAANLSPQLKQEIFDFYSKVQIQVDQLTNPDVAEWFFALRTATHHLPWLEKAFENLFHQLTPMGRTFYAQELLARPWLLPLKSTEFNIFKNDYFESDVESEGSLRKTLLILLSVHSSGTLDEIDEIGSLIAASESSSDRQMAFNSLILSGSYSKKTELTVNELLSVLGKDDSQIKKLNEISTEGLLPTP